jgi:hypothetical protein
LLESAKEIYLVDENSRAALSETVADGYTKLKVCWAKKSCDGGMLVEVKDGARRCGGGAVVVVGSDFTTYDEATVGVSCIGLGASSLAWMTGLPTPI